MTMSGKEDWKSKVRVRMTFHCINFCTAWIFIMYTYSFFNFFKETEMTNKLINLHLLNIY